MARRKSVIGEAGLREWLLEAAVDFRDMYGPMIEGGRAELSKSVDREPVSLRGWELPPDHPARRQCDINRMFMLGAGDVLRIDQGGS